MVAAEPGGDQVPRRRAYEAAHPDVAITPPGPSTALWTARRGGAILASDYELAGLLDAIDWLDGAAAPG